MSFKTSVYASASQAGLAGKTMPSRNAPEGGLGPWVRNQYWPAVATPTGEEVLGLYAVWPDQDNFFAIKIAVSSGTVTVDMGDGTTQTLTSNVQFNYNYSYSASGLYYDANLPYKIAAVRITPTTAGATFSSIDLAAQHTSTTQAYANGWLEAKVAQTVSTLTQFSKNSLNTSSLNLEYVYWSGAFTNNASSTSPFYAQCQSLRRVDLIINNSSNFSFEGLFQQCRRLTDVNITFTGAGRPNSVATMFSGCSSLANAPLFDTSAAANMSNMFTDCVSLQSVPLYDSSSCTIMTNMFNGCAALQSVPLLNTAAVTNMSGMFNGCRSLHTVPLFNTAACTTMQSMFNLCVSLETVPLFNTANVTDMASLFGSCSSLTSVPLFNTVKVTTTQLMFNVCLSIETVPQFNLSACTNTASMFSGCTALKSVPAFSLGAMSNASNMFSNCTALRATPALNLAGISTSANANNIINGAKVFYHGVTGLRFTHTIANNNLNAAALDAYYTGLGTASAQTLTVTGNYGTAGDNPAIATVKGWTVTGS